MANVERNANHFDFMIKNPAELLSRENFIAVNAILGVALCFFKESLRGVGEIAFQRGITDFAH